MKHQTISLVKFKALARRLRQPLCVVVGCLESIWIFAQIQARDGDLTRFSALELAGWIEWPGDEEQLMAALVETGWLDRTPDGRLVIHDWDDHKPNWLKGVSARRGGPGPELEEDAADVPAPVDPVAEANQVPDQVGPSQLPSAVPSTVLGTQPGGGPSTLPPNLTQPNLTHTQPTLSPPTPPPVRGGGERARKRGSPRTAGPPEYPPRFLATWAEAERLAFASTAGSRSRAFAVWAKLPADSHEAIDAAWEAYTAARRAANEKTEHFCNWLAGDWHADLARPAVNERIDPKQLAELADAERKARAAAWRSWESACVLADGAGRPRPPKPTVLTKPPRYYQLANQAAAR